MEVKGARMTGGNRIMALLEVTNVKENITVRDLEEIRFRRLPT